MTMRSLAVAAAIIAVVASTRAEAGRPGQLCNAAITRAAWSDFIVAFNRGDYQQLDALFVPASDFGWYSSNKPGLRNLTAAKNRATLIPYFRTRHAQHDRMQLLGFAYHGDGNFTYRLRRSAADYRNGSWFRLIGKGAATCSGVNAQLVLVSIGAPGSS